MKACFQDFLAVILGKRANEGKGGMLEIAILILQDISNVMLGTRSFQKKFKQLIQPWRLNYMILALNESMKIFFGQIHSFSLFY